MSRAWLVRRVRSVALDELAALLAPKPRPITAFQAACEALGPLSVDELRMLFGPAA